MKARFWMGIAALTFCATACQDDETALNQDNNERKNFTAVMEQSSDSRSAVTHKGVFSWIDGDAINVINTDGTIESPDFTVTDGIGTFSVTNESQYATYPQIAKSYENGELTVELPHTYNYSASTNAAMYANLSTTGEHTTETVTFKHLASVLRIRFSAVPEGITQFVFTATGKKVTGEFTVAEDADDVKKAWVISTKDQSSENTVTFNFDATTNGQTLDFHIPLPIGTYTEFTVALLKGTQEVYTKSTTKGNTYTMTRRKLAMLSDVTNYLADGLYYSTDGGHWTLWESETMPDGEYTSFAVYSKGDNSKLQKTQLTAIAQKEGLEEIDLSQAVYISNALPNKAFESHKTLRYFAYPAHITTVSSKTFKDCTSLKEVALAENMTKISSSAFEGCTSLTEIELPKNITLDQYAFSGCTSLKTINIANVAKYEVSNAAGSCFAFSNCSSLAIDITFPDDMTEILNGTFNGCSSIKSVTFPPQLEGIGATAFKNCTSLTTVDIPETVTTIGAGAFEGTALTSVQLPQNMTAIEGQLFKNCTNITSIDIHDKITSIGNEAFCQTGLVSVTIPGTVSTLGTSVFKLTQTLKEVTILEGESSLKFDQGCFFGCMYVTKISFPSNTVEFGDKVLYGCYRLADIYCYAETAPKVMEKDFGEKIENSGYYTGLSVPKDQRRLHIPKGATNSYTAEIYPDGTENYWKTILIDILGYSIVEDANLSTTD